ncbi:MAG TPA: thiamine pyrophosphate-binding protein, partial [Burkholderiales bacterium]|nr:thiamine pyrophosphate-binding protein [Burkholderiales bacterium]
MAQESPIPASAEKEIWGSDAMAAMLRALDIPYLALNPGASYRGLHDSIVNYLGNTRPQMLLCLHEESAVAIAHGYAKASGRMMGVVLHSNVGLMHGSMAIFNAWCDRVPMLILGATGPWDAARRRPWIDWIHTASDQGALVRDYTKWDNQPASIPATLEALLRALQLAQTPPCAPTYVNLDAALQEAKVGPLPPLPDVGRYRAPEAVLPDSKLVEEAATLLSAAKNPLILGATGPWDAAKRRPWIDWIHTSSDQGALVRDYTKWDNQPASVPAAYEALLRAVQIADTAPRGPTYVN